jgi:hypothetical protein
MGRYMEEMASAGILLAGEGLRPTSEGVRVKFSRGKPTVTDGPFAEAKELVAGWCLIQVDSMEKAIEWVKRWPKIDGDGGVELEIRRLYEADDFGAEFTAELREKEERLRAQVAGSHQR